MIGHWVILYKITVSWPNLDSNFIRQISLYEKFRFFQGHFLSFTFHFFFWNIFFSLDIFDITNSTNHYINELWWWRWCAVWDKKPSPKPAFGNFVVFFIGHKNCFLDQTTCQWHLTSLPNSKIISTVGTFSQILTFWLFVWFQIGVNLSISFPLSFSLSLSLSLTHSFFLISFQYIKCSFSVCVFSAAIFKVNLLLGNVVPHHHGQGCQIHYLSLASETNDNK